MELYTERHADRPHEPAFRNILNIDGLANAASSIRRLENLRRKYAADQNKEGLRLVLEKGREGRAEALGRVNEKRSNDTDRIIYAEIAEWLTLWIQSPEVFETWIDLRISSRDFKEKFPDEIE